MCASVQALNTTMNRGGLRPRSTGANLVPLSQTQHGMATQDHNAGSQRRLTTQQFLLFDGHYEYNTHTHNALARKQ